MSADAATRPKQLVLGFGFGVLFGFLLQKGGVAKYEVLMGGLLLTDFTVMRIMLSAIIVGMVGMVGIFSMHSRGWVKLHVKTTRYAANVIGGLLFGVGFVLLGYCPGTGAAALGQGNFDAIAGVLGLMVGSHLYAEVSDGLSRSHAEHRRQGIRERPDRGLESDLALAHRVSYADWQARPARENCGCRSRPTGERDCLRMRTDLTDDREVRSSRIGLILPARDEPTTNGGHAMHAVNRGETNERTEEHN